MAILRVRQPDGTWAEVPALIGSPGKSVTVEKVTESAESGGGNIVEFSDGKSLTVRNGNDYVLTDTDKDEIAATVKADGITTADISGAPDTNYTVLKARASSLNAASTIPTMNGAIAWTYK